MDDFFHETPRIGLAYSKYLTTLSEKQLADFDYIEVPYELLNFDTGLLPKLSIKPLILHCASLSLGGYTAPSELTKSQILNFVQKTKTPWIGEHLSYILADKLDDNYYEPYSTEPYNVGYTVNPIMNSQSVDNVIKNIQQHQAYLNTQIIVENSPLYFKLSASNMSQTEFINAICENSDSRLLLDLTHWFISSKNFSFNAKKELEKLPLHRVTEVHISGVTESGDTHWDNHADRAPKIIFELLDIVLKHVTPKAITFEYNWTPNIEWSSLRTEFELVRQMLQGKLVSYDG
jgi:uncharacterized protein